MKRILLVLTVALVMAAMVVAMAAPALAAGKPGGVPPCTGRACQTAHPIGNPTDLP